jgi:hypothetical protein
MVIRPHKRRPNLSSFHTMSVSPASSFFRQRNRAGRLVVARDKSSSLNTVVHPALFRAASCRAGVCSSVDTRVVVFHAFVVQRTFASCQALYLRGFPQWCKSYPLWNIAAAGSLRRAGGLHIRVTGRHRTRCIRVIFSLGSTRCH